MTTDALADDADGVGAGFAAWAGDVAVGAETPLQPAISPAVVMVTTVVSKEPVSEACVA